MNVRLASAGKISACAEDVNSAPQRAEVSADSIVTSRAEAIQYVPCEQGPGMQSPPRPAVLMELLREESKYAFGENASPSRPIFLTTTKNTRLVRGWQSLLCWSLPMSSGKFGHKLRPRVTVP